jgi:hypothetical protein
LFWLNPPETEFSCRFLSPPQFSFRKAEKRRSFRKGNETSFGDNWDQGIVGGREDCPDTVNYMFEFIWFLLLEKINMNGIKTI